MILFSSTYDVGGGEKIARSISLGISYAKLICFYKCNTKVYDPNKVSFIIERSIPKSKVIKLLDLIYILAWVVFFFIKTRPSYVQSHIHFVSIIIYLAKKISFVEFAFDCVSHGRINCELNKGLYTKLLIHVYKNCRNIICVSEGMVSEFVDLGINNVIVIRNSVTVNYKNQETKPKAGSNFLRAIILSRLEPVKNIESIIQAVSVYNSLGLKRIVIDIYGLGTSENKLKYLCTELGVNNVRFMGFSEHVTTLFKDYDFLINSSKSETFSLAILESLLNKLPVITSNCKFGPMDILQVNDEVYNSLSDFTRVSNHALVYNQSNDASLLNSLVYFSENSDLFYVSNALVNSLISRYSFDEMISSYEKLSSEK